MTPHNSLRSAVAVCLLAGAAAAHAQYPTRPIRLVVGFPPGGLTDVSARLIAANSELSQSMVVENRPGAGSLIAVHAVADAAPDGYTLGYVSTAVTQQPAVSKSWNVDPVKQFAPISMVVQFPLAVAINPKKHPARTLAEFMAEGRANPGKFNFATVTTNGGDVMILKMLSRAGNMDAQLVNYKGGMASSQAVVTGEADAVTVAPQTALVLVRQQDSMRLLAITGSTRFRLLPDVPTFQESGYPGININNWFGFVSPAGTAARVISTLNVAIVAALKVPQVQKALIEGGTDIVGNTPEEFGRLIAADLAMYRRMVAEGVVDAGD